MSKTQTPRTPGDVELSGFFGGLTNLIEKLGELAEKGKDLQELKQFGSEDGKVQGVYGFTIKTAGGGEQNGGVKVQPFGNVRKDKETGRATVQEVTEPPVDIFEETNHILVVAELPGIGPEDVQVELREDILMITAERNSKKYRKEVLLPATFTAEALSHTCRNGILEAKLSR